MYTLIMYSRMYIKKNRVHPVDLLSIGFSVVVSSMYIQRNHEYSLPFSLYRPSFLILNSSGYMKYTWITVDMKAQ